MNRSSSSQSPTHLYYLQAVDVYPELLLRKKILMKALDSEALFGGTDVCLLHGEI